MMVDAHIVYCPKCMLATFAWCFKCGKTFFTELQMYDSPSPKLAAHCLAWKNPRHTTGRVAPPWTRDMFPPSSIHTLQWQMTGTYMKSTQQIDRQIRQIDQVDRQIDRQRERQIDRQIDRSIDRQIVRQIDSQLYRQIDNIQIDRQLDRQIDRLR